MGTIQIVLDSLQIDSSFFIQFALVTILYFVLRNLFLNNLQEVLELREDNTTRMESGADKKINEAEKVAAEYKSKIEEARGEAFKIISTKKDEVISRENKKLKEHETTLEKDLNDKKSVFETELEEKKKNIMTQAQGLSDELVNKIVQ